MNPAKEAIQRMADYLEHGELKAMAKKLRIPEHRAKSLVSGRLKITEADYPFIDAIYNVTIARKKRLDKLEVFTPSLTLEEIAMMRDLIRNVKKELKK